MTMGEDQDDDDKCNLLRKYPNKTQYQINVEVKYIFFKQIIKSLSKHKIYKLWASSDPYFLST